MKKIVVYAMKGCSSCMQAETLLKSRGVAFEKIMVDYEDDAKWDELYAMSGMKTLPQIWAGEQLIGGFPQLAEIDRKDRLASLKGD